MKHIFLTGVTGYIGGSVAVKLVAAGYSVTALVRQPADAARVQALGIQTVTGSIQHPALIRRQLQAADAFINTATADDPYFIALVLDTLAHTGKTFIQTSGSSIVADKAAGAFAAEAPLEDLPTTVILEKTGRVAIDRAVVGAAQNGIHSIVICPPMVYGQGLGLKTDSIQVPALYATARQLGQSVMIGEGRNIWSNVHIEDLADLYILALEKANAGSFFYAENGLNSLAEIAATIRRRSGLATPVRQLTMDEATALWGAEGAHTGFGSNSWLLADKARHELGWAPRHADMLAII